ncbi:hypothetical protein DPMN_127394 [Dreissena polymorpha]|uniref:Uncharacterized protein n=1 Tax=Dreissena polymorpha TaxID=45954 RepID=A0A9D4JYS4_DREPO|nr:hypothetical protein DPMN_127394 [Dreissena polymorpha]
MAASLLTEIEMSSTKFNKSDLEEVALHLVEQFKMQVYSDTASEIKRANGEELVELWVEVQALRDENTHLRKCIKATNLARDDLKQYGRRMMLEISGLPDDTGDANENVEQKLLDKARDLKLQLNSCDIVRIHRLG